MEESHNTDAPLSMNRQNVFLAALHVLVLVCGMMFHPVVETGVDGALP